MPRVVARKAEGQAPAGVAKGEKAAPAKRAKRDGKQAKAAEPKPLGKAELERVGKVIAAHAALRTLGCEIETRARIYPMHGTPAGLVKSPAVEIALPRELYEASRIARGPGPWKGAWKRVVLSKAEGVRKRAALKAAMARHRAALEDEGALGRAARARPCRSRARASRARRPPALRAPPAPARSRRGGRGRVRRAARGAQGRLL